MLFYASQTLAQTANAPARTCESLFAKLPTVHEQEKALVAAAKVRFKELGVKWQRMTLNGYFTFHILPNDRTQFGRLAQDMQHEYDGLLYYSPGLIAEQEAAAMFTIDANTLQSILLLAHQNVFDDRKLLRSTYVIHELRHVQVHEDAKLGIPSAYHGRAYVLDGRLPDKRNPHVEQYSQELAFSEMLTFYHQVRQELMRLRRLLKTQPYDHKVIQAQALAALASIRFWYITSSRSDNVVDVIRANFDSTLRDSRFEWNEVLEFHATDIKTDSGSFGIKLPLTEAKGRSASNQNIRALKRQLNLLKTVSEYHAGISSEALHRYEWIYANTLSKPDVALKHVEGLYRAMLGARSIVRQ